MSIKATNTRSQLAGRLRMNVVESLSFGLVMICVTSYTLASAWRVRCNMPTCPFCAYPQGLKAGEFPVFEPC